MFRRNPLKSSSGSAVWYTWVIGFALGTPPLGAEAPAIPGIMVFAATSGDDWDLFAWYGRSRSKLIRLTETPYDEKSPALSNDRRMLAFATSGGELATHDLETGETKTLELTDHGGHWDFPTFSPDGKKLVCTYFEGDARDRAKLAVIDLETRQVRFPLD